MKSKQVKFSVPHTREDLAGWSPSLSSRFLAVPRLLHIVLTTVWVYSITLLETVLGVLIFPLLYAGYRLVTRWSTARIMRHLVWVYGNLWVFLIRPFVSVSKEGLAEVDFESPGIIVANHRSFVDTYFMSVIPQRNITIALRSWPFRTLFWYAPFMKMAGYLDVEQDSYENTLADVRAVAVENRQVLLFPEGHRGRDGKLGKFYSGAFKLSVDLGIPVLPICILGTEVMLPPGRFHIAPARIKIHALPAIDPAPYMGDHGHMAMRKQVRKLMEQHIAEMQ